MCGGIGNFMYLVRIAPILLPMFHYIFLSCSTNTMTDYCIYVRDQLKLNKSNNEFPDVTTLLNLNTKTKPPGFHDFRCG